MMTDWADVTSQVVQLPLGWAHATYDNGTPSTTNPRPAPDPETPMDQNNTPDKPDTTQGEGPSAPDVPQPRDRPAERDTPEERRDAWLTVMAELEAHVIATMRQAEMGIARHVAEPGLHPEGMYETRYWAARKLLADIQTLKAPEVPEDPELGQGVIEGPWG